MPDPKPAPVVASRFCAVRVGNPVRDEWTNVGIVVFGPDGRRLAYRVAPLDRAREWGDWPQDDDEGGILRLVEMVESLEDLKRMEDRSSYAMGAVRLGRMGTSFRSPESVLEAVWRFLIVERAPSLRR